MKRVAKFLALAVVTVTAAFAFSGDAQAHSRFFFGFNLGPPAVYPYPVYPYHYPYYYRYYSPRYYYPRYYYPRHYYPRHYYPRHYSRAYPPRAYHGYLWTQVEPNHAEVFVDGAYIGRVKDFDGPVHHAALPAGRHLVEFRAPGYKTYSVEVYISPGATTSIEYDLAS